MKRTIYHQSQLPGLRAEWEKYAERKNLLVDTLDYDTMLMAIWVVDHLQDMFDDYEAYYNYMSEHLV